MTDKPLRLQPWYPYLTIDLAGPRFLKPQSPAPITPTPILLPRVAAGAIPCRPVAQELLYALHHAGRLRDAFQENPDCRHPDYPPAPLLRRATTRFRHAGADYDTQHAETFQHFNHRQPLRFIDALDVHCRLDFEDDTHLSLPLPFAVCGTGTALEEDFLFVISQTWRPTEDDLYGFLERACFTFLDDDGADSVSTQLEAFRLRATEILQPYFRPDHHTHLADLLTALGPRLRPGMPLRGVYELRVGPGKPRLDYTPEYVYQHPLPAVHQQA